MKLLIFGNCGCGKTYLANQLSLLTNIEVVNLDRIMWIPGTDLFRDSLDIEKDLQNIMKLDNYIIEGVWGKVMEFLITNDKIDLLVFLEVDINECTRNILRRISNEENGMIPYEERMKIVKYANNYYIKNLTTENIDSPLELDLHKQFNYSFHKNIYDTFIPYNGKIYLQNRITINTFINTFLDKYPLNYITNL
jgi:deoxyadenosine/deoxycytidine kinase